MAVYDNSAYDFEAFEPRRKKVEQPGFEPEIVRAPKRSKKEREAQRLFQSMFLKVIAVSLAFLLLLGAKIFLQVSLTEQVKTLDDYNMQIKDADSYNNALNNKLYSMMSLEEVEKKAVNELHMVKRDSSQIRYISVEKADNYTDGVRVDG